MPTSNSLDVLLAHHRWAMSNIINACNYITAEQFHRKFEMGPGSLHDTITPTLSATRIWTDMLAGREERPRFTGTVRTVVELLTLFREICAGLITIAAAHPVDELVSRSLREKTYTFPRGGILTHVTTHGMHHQAQCLNMLRHVGVNPLPQSSVVEWMMAGEPVPA